MVTIIKAQPNQALEVQKVFYDTWLHTYPNVEYGITKADLQIRFKYMLSEGSIKKLKKLIGELNSSKNTLFLVAKISGKIVGVSVLEKEETFNRFQSVYILPEYQNQGIGKKFWGVATKFFDSTKDTILEVAVYNKKAISFYKKLGFVDTGKRFTEEKTQSRQIALRPMMEMRLFGFK